jgi:hypothetical protein
LDSEGLIDRVEERATLGAPRQKGIEACEFPLSIEEHLRFFAVEAVIASLHLRMFAEVSLYLAQVEDEFEESLAAG